MKIYIATLAILAPSAAQLSSVPKLRRGADAEQSNESRKAGMARVVRRTVELGDVLDGLSMSQPMSLAVEYIEAVDPESWWGGGKSEKSSKTAKRRGLEATRRANELEDGLSMSQQMSLALDVDFLETDGTGGIESWWGGGKSEKSSKTAKRRGLEATRRVNALEDGPDGLSMSQPMSLDVDFLETDGTDNIESWWGGGKSEKSSKTAKRRGLEATRRANELEDGLSMSQPMSLTLDVDFLETDGTDNIESWWGGGKSEKSSKTAKRRGLEATRRANELEDTLSMSQQMSLALDVDFLETDGTDNIESWWGGGKSEKSSKTAKRRGLEATRRANEVEDGPDGLSMSQPMSLDVDFLETDGNENIESWWGGGKSEKSSKTAKRR